MFISAKADKENCCPFLFPEDESPDLTREILPTELLMSDKGSLFGEIVLFANSESLIPSLLGEYDIFGLWERCFTEEIFTESDCLVARSAKLGCWFCFEAKSARELPKVFCPGLGKAECNTGDPDVCNLASSDNDNPEDVTGDPDIGLPCNLARSLKVHGATLLLPAVSEPLST